MRNKFKFTDGEIKLMKEMNVLFAQAQADPRIRDMPVPDSLWYELQRDICEYEEERKAKEQAE